MGGGVQGPVAEPMVAAGGGLAAPAAPPGKGAAAGDRTCEPKGDHTRRAPFSLGNLQD